MKTRDLAPRLDPARCPDMSPQMGAIVGYLFERAYTTPALAELTVTPDGHLLGRPRVEGDIGHTIYMAAKLISVPICDGSGSRQVWTRPSGRL